MHLKIGLAAAVFAAVGTFAFAEGAGEGQGGCGDGDCWVGTIQNHTLSELGMVAGHKEGVFSNSGGFYDISGLGVHSAGNVVGKSYVTGRGEIDTTGNCDSDVGQNSGVGCN